MRRSYRDGLIAIGGGVIMLLVVWPVLLVVYATTWIFDDIAYRVERRLARKGSSK